MERFIGKYKNGHFDLIIIGGGITGAALAYEAGTRGLKVALFEKNDFGAATSSATSKLIHGGLRYLKNLELGLVRESLRERRILSNIAPNFVYPIPFMMPSYRKFKRRKWLMLTAMVMYDMLSYDKGNTSDPTKSLPHFKSCSRSRTLKMEPCVMPQGMTGSTVYYDCQNIFPERLTLAFLKSAEAFGASLSNYARVVSFIRKNDRVEGVRVVDVMTGKEGHFTAPVIVNCAGPWADSVIKSASSENTKHNIRRSEGIHIVTRKICVNHAVTMMTKQSRHIMVMPWRGYSLIGTTDKEYFGNPDDYKVSKKTILGLLEEVNENFRGADLKYEDVLFYYGGLRPLADNDTENSYESSRKYEIFDNADEGLDGLFTVEGGKYTTSRQLAVDVMKKLQKNFSTKFQEEISYNRPLYGCDINNMEVFLDKLKIDYPDFSMATVEYLGKNYGTECHDVLHLARKNAKLAEVLNEDGELLAEVVYALENELALSLADILFRRTGIGTLGNPGKAVVEKVAAVAAAYLNWDEQKRKSEIQLVMKRFLLPDA
jgi:glycerol-3-phosphate dehydrogenase